MVFLALAKGGNSDWARAVATTAVPLLFLFCSIPFLLSQDRPAHSPKPWIFVWLVVTLWIAIQLVPGLGNIFNSPFAQNCIDAKICDRTRISPYPLATLSHWAMFSAYWMVAWMVSRLGFYQIRLLALVLCLLALFEATYGVMAFLQGQETILGIWKKEYFFRDVTGTFVNRNHFAGFLEVSWPLSLSFLLMSRQSGGFRIPRNVRYGLAFVFCFFMALALVNSHSRFGVFSGIVGLLVWYGLMQRHGKFRRESNFHKWVGISALVVVIIGIIWFGAESFVDRFVKSTNSAGRLPIWTETLTLPPSIWLTGIGAGAFVDVFATVQSAELELKYTFAHSDVLEFLIDYGLIGSILILAAMGYWIHCNYPRRMTRLHIGALAGIVAILVHSLVDFNLHIPGVAMVFWVCVGILANSNLYNANSRGSRRQA